jgi:hypothetical protein
MTFTQACAFFRKKVRRSYRYQDATLEVAP